MGITKFVFGFDKSDVTALQESQLGDATQFQKISDLLGELQKSQTGDAEKFQKVQEYLDGLQEKVETLTEAVGEQEKIMAICIIVSAVAAIAITSFVAFCIYQGVKCEREKEKNLSKDTPDAKLNNVDAIDGNEKKHMQMPD